MYGTYTVCISGRSELKNTELHVLKKALANHWCPWLL